MTRLKLLLAYLFTAVLVWAAAWAVSVRRLKGGEPGRFVDQQVALAEAGQDAEAANAWPELAGAAARYDALVQSRRRGGKPGLSVDGWDRAWAATASVEELGRLREDVAALDRAGFDAALDAIAAGRRFVRPRDRVKPLLGPFSESAGVQGLAACARARMALAAKDGDGARFARSLRQGLAISGALRAQASPDTMMVSVSIDRRLGWSLQGLAGSMEAPLLRGALDGLGASYRRPDLASAVRGQILCDLDCVEVCYSADGRLVPAAAAWVVEEPGAERTLAGSMAKLRLFWGPSKEETLSGLSRLHQAAMKEASMPLRERLSAGPCGAEIAAAPAGQIFVHGLGPMTARFLQLAESGDLEIAGAKVMLALELHRRERGAFPASLAEMDPPLGTLDLRPEWAAEFVYKTRGAGAYVLYWIGMDGRDDGGASPAKGDRPNPFLEESRGVDYVFTPGEP